MNAVAPEIALEQKKDVIRRAAARNWPRAAPSFTLSGDGGFLEDGESKLAWAVTVGANSVFFRPVRWEQREEASGAVIEVAIPVERAAPSPDPVRADMRRVHDLLDALHRGETLRRRVLAVAASDAAEVARLAASVPPNAHDAAGSPLGWGTSLRVLARASAEAAAMLVTLQATSSAVADFLAEAEPRLRTWMIDAAGPVPHGIASVRPLGQLGADVLATPRSAAAEDLDSLDDLLSRLRRAHVEIGTALPILDVLTRRLVTATAAAIAQVESRETAVALERLAREVEALKQQSPAARLAAEACARLG